jgi:hypothetical protein
MNMKRMRGRNHRPNGGGGGGGGGFRNQQNGIPLNRNHVFDSSGPEMRVRGTAQQLFEKYTQMARDASSNGDRVTGEAYYQHAEHYFRIISAINQAQGQPPAPNGATGERPPYQQNGEQRPYNNQGHQNQGNGEYNRQDEAPREEFRQQEPRPQEPRQDRQERRFEPRNDRQGDRPYEPRSTSARNSSASRSSSPARRAPKTASATSRRPTTASISAPPLRPSWPRRRSRRALVSNRLCRSPSPWRRRAPSPSSLTPRRKRPGLHWRRRRRLYARLVRAAARAW